MYNYSFDPTKFKLGNLCRRGHEWEGSGQSLRTYRNSCVECSKLTCQRHYQAKKQKLDIERQQKAESEPQTISTELLSQLDTSKFKLGTLCINNHDWNSTGKSLRYKCQGSCVECRKLYIRQYYEQNKDRITEVNKQYALANPGVKNKAKAKYRSTHRNELRAKGKEYSQRKEVKLRVRERNYKPEVIEYRQTYWRSPHGKHVSYRNANKRRAREKQAHHYQYTVEDLKQLREKFDSKCVYCGSDERLTIDHVIPIARGGADVLGNFTIACFSCNASKNDSEVETWYKAQPFFSASRWKKIQKHYKFVATGQLPLL